MSGSKMIPAAEVAELLDVHVESLYRSWRKWGLKAYRIGREIKFKQIELTEWIAGQEIARGTEEDR